MWLSTFLLFSPQSPLAVPLCACPSDTLRQNQNLCEDCLATAWHVCSFWCCFVILLKGPCKKVKLHCTRLKPKYVLTWVGSRAALFRTPPGPAIQLATKPAFHLVIKSSLNPTEIPLNLTENPLNLTERARNQTERIAVSNAALIAKLIASKLLGSKEKDLLKLLNPPKF